MAFRFPLLPLGVCAALLAAGFAVVLPARTEAHYARAAVQTLFVSPTGSDNNDGTQAMPYKTIRAAINNASSGDTVTLLDGTYGGNGNRDLDFGGKALTLNSQNGAEKTIIDCGGTTEEPHRAVYLHSKEKSADFVGLTIKNGCHRQGGGMEIISHRQIGAAAEPCSVAIKECVFTNNRAFSSEFGGGGGIYNTENLTLDKCTFTKNVADYGCGGVQNEGTAIATNCAFNSNGGGGFLGSGSVTDCVFEANDGSGCSNSTSTYIHGKDNLLKLTGCVFKGNTARLYGGGVYGTDIIATKCTFIKNTAQIAGGGFGSNLSGGVVEFNGCTFTNNVAIFGGGFFGSGTLNGCTFINNSATHDAKSGIAERSIRGPDAAGGASSGGGVYLEGGTLTNCLLYGNKSKEDGGGIFGDFSLRYCTLYGNKAERKSGALQAYRKQEITNCIIWGNDAPDAPEIGTPILSNAEITLTYTDIQGGMSGTGNLKADPLFVDPQNGDFHLKPGSPCIGAGIAIMEPNPAAQNTPQTPAVAPQTRPVAPQPGVKAKPGAPTPPTPKPAPIPAMIPIATDLDGKPRLADKPSIGAYEGAK